MVDTKTIEILSKVTTATITTILLKKGLGNVWLRGARPLRPGQPRLAGRAFTLRFVPAREDLATPELWSSPKSTRAAIEFHAGRLHRSRGCDGGQSRRHFRRHPVRKDGQKGRRRARYGRCRTGFGRGARDRPADMVSGRRRRRRSPGSRSSTGRSRSHAAALRCFPAISSWRTMMASCSFPRLSSISWSSRGRSRNGLRTGSCRKSWRGRRYRVSTRPTPRAKSAMKQRRSVSARSGPTRRQRAVFIPAAAASARSSASAT